MILCPLKQISMEMDNKDYELIIEVRPTNERNSKISIRSSKERLELKHTIDKAIYEYRDEIQKYEITREITYSEIAEVRKIIEVIDSIDFENYDACKERGYDGTTIVIAKIMENDKRQIGFWNPSRKDCQEVYDVMDRILQVLENTLENDIESQQIVTLKKYLEYKD